MAAPFIFINTSAIKEASSRLQEVLQDVLQGPRGKRAGALAINAYVNEYGTEVTFVDPPRGLHGAPLAVATSMSSGYWAVRTTTTSRSTANPVTSSWRRQDNTRIRASWSVKPEHLAASPPSGNGALGRGHCSLQSVSEPEHEYTDVHRHYGHALLTPHAT